MFTFLQSVWPWSIFSRGGWFSLPGDGEDCGGWCGMIVLDLVASLGVSEILFQA